MKNNAKLRYSFAGLLTALASSAMAQTIDMQVTGLREGRTLNVRSGPDVSYKDIGAYQPNAIIPILGYDPSGQWAILEYQGQIGYVARGFLKESTAQSNPGPDIGQYVVTGIKADDADGGLVVRQGAGTKHARLGVLKNHTMVQVIERNHTGKWAKIHFGSTTGWVSMAYLSAAKHPQPKPKPEPPFDPQTAPDGGSLPADFTVTGVLEGDVLRIRDAPDPQANSIGGFAPQQGVRVLSMAKENWARVRFGSGSQGYANIRYLTRNGANSDAAAFQTGITCQGTEPFWTLGIHDNHTVSFHEMTSGPAPIVPLLQVVSTSLSGGYPYSFTATPYTGLIQRQACSDGMSERHYTMSIVLNTPTGQGGLGTVYGCCNVD